MYLTLFRPFILHAFTLLNAWLIDCLFVYAALGTSSASRDMGTEWDGMGRGDMELIRHTWIGWDWHGERVIASGIGGMAGGWVWILGVHNSNLSLLFWSTIHTLRQTIKT